MINLYLLYVQFLIFQTILYKKKEKEQFNLIGINLNCWLSDKYVIFKLKLYEPSKAKIEKIHYYEGNLNLKK